MYAFDYQDGYRFDGYDEESVEEDYRNKKLIQNKMYQVHLKEYEKIKKELMKEYGVLSDLVI